MKTTIIILSTMCLLAFHKLSAQIVNVQDAIKNAPKEVPDKVSFVKKENGKTISSKTITYSYDKEGRLTEIKSNNGDYTFKYSYATQEYVFGSNERVSSITVIFKNNNYVKADFTYNKLGELSKIVRSGQERDAFELYYDKGTYTWKDKKGRTNKLKVDGYKITEHLIGGDAFIFTYDKGKNGIENMLKPITLTTYMAMEYYNTDFYSSGFLQCIMPQPLKSITDPRENGKIYTFSNTKGLYTYLKESSVKEGTYLNTWTFSYRKPTSELKIDPKVLENKKVDKIKIK
ncbi:hypothetical protein G6R40_05455 [Chryseobacterium sp. POL2]|uniref:hypothetical protein n=1 Tax=Chryseobacterium sp. POL2 TaxID=2713414 RepID=UPI0013E178D5|nr:hypothetical protein [Chryseobacterium sp. POL2]QIG89153.1 hypothetical protein G6R40_05455 [Chryseobacterium sp. POL2]